MEVSSVLNKNKHLFTIIHLDMDYFYAQVAEIRNPTLRTKPLGVQQKNMVVTCNYIARQQGVTKLMTVTEAMKKCPSLLLVNGEDLTPYRQMSQRMFDILHQYTSTVEKLGLDEFYIDVTSLIKRREEAIKNDSDGDTYIKAVGNIHPPNGATLSACPCGCAYRLAFGTRIAQEIRSELKQKLGITCCAGVAYNKLLAKLVGAQNRPNHQTVLISTHAEQFMRELKYLSRVTGIGQKTESLLLENGIANIEDLQLCDMDFLRKKFGFETATKLKDLAFGRDRSLVQPSGKPKTISLENSCRPISVRTDVEDRFRVLLMRLMEQVAEDGRIPIALKVILRKFDAQKKTSHRETKQANILPSLFKATACTVGSIGSKVVLADGAQEKLLKIIMRLFERVVDMGKSFKITLIGLAFSKFQQKRVESSSIANYFIKKTDLEVQSIMSLTNTGMFESYKDGGFHSTPATFQPSDQFHRRRTTIISPIPMLVDNGSESAATNSDFSDFSETEVEPSPKKSRLGQLLMAGHHCVDTSATSITPEVTDVASPSKLRVCDLHLNSRDSEKEFSSSLYNISASNAIFPLNSLSTKPKYSALSTQISSHRINISSTALPNRTDRLKEESIRATPSHPFAETYCLKHISLQSVKQQGRGTVADSTPDLCSSAIATPPEFLCPRSVDREVFNELPIDVQNELMISWRNSLAVAAATVTGDDAAQFARTEVKSESNSKGRKEANVKEVTTNGKQKSALYHYFLINK